MRTRAGSQGSPPSRLTRALTPLPAGESEKREVGATLWRSNVTESAARSETRASRLQVRSSRQEIDDCETRSAKRQKTTKKIVSEGEIQRESDFGNDNESGVQNNDRRKPILSTPTKQVKSGSILSRAKSLFHRSSRPKRIVGRESHRLKITEFLNSHIEGRTGGAFYLSGVPGTGKTALLMEILDDFDEKCCNPLFINCMTCSEPKLIFAKLLSHVQGREAKHKDPSFELEKLFQNSKGAETTMHLVILDEIDALLSTGTSHDVLYKIFEWTLFKKSNLIVIGIANALDLTDRFLPRLKARGCTPEHLNFPPYTAPEISAILNDRLRSIVEEETPAGTDVPAILPLIQSSAIELAARKVAGTGDVRKALDICRQALDLLDSTFKSPNASRRLTPLANSTARTPNAGEMLIISPTNIHEIPKITVAQILRITSSALDSVGYSKRTEKIMKQSAPGVGVLISAVYLAQKSKTREVTLGHIHDIYATLSRRAGAGIIPWLSRSDFMDLVGVLENNGLISSAIKKGCTSFGGSSNNSLKANGWERKMHVELAEKDLRAAFQKMTERDEKRGCPIQQGTRFGTALDLASELKL